jgi:ATP-dependent Clp protease, protease subunit
MMNVGQEFQSYYTKHLGKPSLDLHNFNNHIQNSMTPYILEEREMRVTQMDIFSRLMMDRILWASGPVDERMGDIIQSQIIFLDNLDKKKDINLYLQTPGGSVLNGLGIRDTMNFVTADVATTNLGMCASMGSVLLSSGAKGKRASLIHSKVMTHMVSHGTQGNVQDTRINQLEAEKYNYILFKILAENCGKTFDEMLESSRNDKWFNSDEALEFGLIDKIVGIDKNKSMTDMMEGFDEYYEKEILKRVR